MARNSYPSEVMVQHHDGIVNIRAEWCEPGTEFKGVRLVMMLSVIRANMRQFTET